MTEYDDLQDRRDTTAEDHDRALARRDRMMDRAPAGTAEPPLEAEGLARLATDPSIHEIEVDVLPRDLDDHPQARATVERLAEDYDSVEIDRLPPVGALHWLLRLHRGHAVYVCRITADGRLLSVQR